MRNRIISLFIQMILATSVLTAQPATQTIKGIFYLDEEPVAITFSQGVITGIKHLPANSEVPKTYIAPGLVDIQINGYMGVDFANTDLTVEKMRTATREMWKTGVTSYLPTVITNSAESLETSFTTLAKVLNDPEIGNSIPGFHLEGPYISPVQGFRGAHLEKYIRKPDWQEFQKLQKAAGNGIKLITVAPEMEGAIPFIEKCVESGVAVSLGHHNGNAQQITAAIDAGATLATHIGNGCANMINRHHNPIWPQLSDDRLSIDIIADGFHLTKEEVRSFYKVKGAKKTILVSDALDLAGLPPGKYIRGEREVLLTPNVVKFPAENVLAGAASPLSAHIGNIMRFTQCSLKEAIGMASSNPARLIGLTDRGEIAQGKRADFVLFTLVNGKMVISKTIVAGETVYKKE